MSAAASNRIRRPAPSAARCHSRCPHGRARRSSRCSPARSGRRRTLVPSRTALSPRVLHSCRCRGTRAAHRISRSSLPSPGSTVRAGSDERTEGAPSRCPRPASRRRRRRSARDSRALSATCRTCRQARPSRAFAHRSGHHRHARRGPFLGRLAQADAQMHVGVAMPGRVKAVPGGGSSKSSSAAAGRATARPTPPRSSTVRP